MGRKGTPGPHGEAADADTDGEAEAGQAAAAGAGAQEAEAWPPGAGPGPPLWRLPEELLLLICSYLDSQALGRLGQVSRRLQRFTSRDLLWRPIARACLNSGFTRHGTDLVTNIPVKERVKVSQNWRRGRCRQGTLLKWRRNLMPWMQLEGGCLYLSQAEDIHAYQLCPDGSSLRRRPLAIFSGHEEDVCRFVLASSHVVSGGGDGKIGLHKINGTFSIKFSAHEQEVNCVDCQGGVIVSGSRDRTAKVWSLSSSQLGQCLHTIQTEDRVWSIAISPLLSSFVTGTACCGHVSPLRIWDLTRKCVMEWEEPHDSALYCVQSDGNHMLASGSSYYGVVRLWDRRQKGCLHAFSLSSPTSSPVYCLRFSTTHLYAAVASALHVLDFKTP
ncbi:F-box/WD repeat-containing protein 4 isoform X4 [Phascolarctos cinereus]|uniref:F-box/WD repeat-containing protein 4 isoform X4 n=1 Tax=Phascolarctos cinereus TaxID=38626 RepID=A0A6P5IKU2_PHACI|nr:F-box/WD repeat-containing protein 4 isoform X4 [Phascolarctos cinereus]